MTLSLAYVAYWIVILLHICFAVLEMVLWKTKGVKVFRMSQEFANKSAFMATNQGLYNLFLVAALLIGFFAPNEIGASFALYGLICVIAAGVWGAITIHKRVFLIQALPAVIALLLIGASQF